MSARRAPIALRTPISWVRSVTEMSMMFITPDAADSRPIELITVVRITSGPVSWFHRLLRKSGELSSKSLSSGERGASGASPE